MELGLRGRTAVVAASTGGLGEAVARALAAEGAAVVVSGRRGERASAIAAELPRAVGVEVDLGDEDGPARLVEAAEQAFGPVDIAVLNGPGPKPGTAAGLTSDDLDTALS
jgi:3-oxoacyl-[acyl-carrier protein] reductase